MYALEYLIYHLKPFGVDRALRIGSNETVVEAAFASARANMGKVCRLETSMFKFSILG